MFRVKVSDIDCHCVVVSIWKMRCLINNLETNFV